MCGDHHAGSFDIDVAVFIKEYTYEDRKAARELVTGLRLGGLVLEAKDVEVLTKVSDCNSYNNNITCYST
jgi:hypothetical protein